MALSASLDAAVRRLRPALVFVLAMLMGAVAEARPVVVVAEFQDPAGARTAAKVREAISQALLDGDKVDLVPLSKLSGAAARRGLRGRDLVSPRLLGELARDEVAAQAVITGRIFKRRREVLVSIAVNDTNAKEIWSRAVPLKAGLLSADVAKRYAAAIAAAAASIPPPGSEPQPQVEAKPKEERAPSESEAAPDKEDAEAEAPKPPVKPKETPEPKIVAEEPPAAVEAPRPVGPHPDMFELEAAITITWRSYRFCPEVDNCDLPTPVGAGSPVKYSTDVPYGGLQVAARVFPFAESGMWVDGFGLAGTFGRSLALRTHYLDEDRQDQTFNSTEQRLGAELLYRLMFDLDGLRGFVGARAGYLWHTFAVDPNPKVVESRRSGLTLGLDVSMPLNRFVRAELEGSLVPLASPGDAEKQVYGAAASGGGFGVQGGLGTDLGHPEWGLGLSGRYELMHFGDRYANAPGARPGFGRALEDYHSLRFEARKGF